MSNELKASEWSRTRYAVVRRCIINGAESVDTDHMDLTPALAIGSAMKYDAQYPIFAEENPIIALVRVEVTPFDVMNIEKAIKQSEEIDAEIAAKKAEK
jgi:hypothetical protein